MSYLSEQDLLNLKNHEYHSAGSTKLDKLMNPYWEFCAKLLPYWITPNMVTLIGFFCMASSLIVIGVNDLTYSKDLPYWIYFYNAIMMFVNQTLDAMDGKHARNTKRSSSLGQLLDHGCDALSSIILSTNFIQSLKLGPTIYSFMFLYGIQINFYTTNLEERFTGVLSTCFGGYWGVTEYQFFGMTAILFPVIFGNLFRDIKITENFTVLDSMIVGTLFGSTVQVLAIVLKDYKGLKNFIIKWKYLFFFYIFVFAEYLSTKLFYFQKYPFVVFFLNGIIFGIICCRLIVDNMSKREIHLINLDICVYTAIILIAFISGNKTVELICLIILFFYEVVRFYQKIIAVIIRLEDYLK
ncbi:MAG: CDP-alcohol phosphatidyltransferase family protein [archaeon]|nr:CDP-alcohol phosphatidyltransferase family protein [archaeon]